MSRNYDNWERLVEAVLDREKLRQLAREPSFNSLTSDFSSRFSFDSTLQEYVPGLDVPRPFSYYELKKATRNFRPSPLVGEVGSQYDSKGWIDEHTLTAARPGSGLAITVKLPGGFQDPSEWLTKVKFVGQLRHPNLVKLIGYCIEGDNQLLVCEFMPRGSLDMHLPRGPYQIPLSWETRVNVAIGVARALSFLHDSKPPVIHGHVKASTILLDEDFNGKLEGFTSGEPDDPSAAVLARGDTPHPCLLATQHQHHHPPEYLFTGEWTAKIDVYSFGIVLLQLLSGRRAFDPQKPCDEQNLVGWAKPYLSNKRKLFRIIDHKLENLYPKKAAHRLAAIALVCLTSNPKLRPSMIEVLAALEQQVKLSSTN